MSPAHQAPRVCSVCGATQPADGPLPWQWDQHWLHVGEDSHGRPIRKWFTSCSKKCRAKRGWLERRCVE